MPEWVVPVVVAVIGTYGTAWATRVGRKGDRENALLDQYQEDRREDRERIDALSKKVDQLERELHELLRRDSLWQVHAERVEAQVITLGGVPAPRPAGLINSPMFLGDETK